MRGGGKSILNTQLPVCHNRASFLHNSVVKTIVIHSSRGGHRKVLASPLSDSPIDRGLDMISDSPIVLRIRKSDIRYPDSPTAEKRTLQ
jgi:hypothetical protein